MPVVLPSGPSAAGLDEYQIEIRGLVLGRGTPYKIADIQGHGAPDVRDFDRPRPNDHGAYISRRDLLGVRRLQVNVMCVAPGSGAGATALMDQLSGAWRVPKAGIEVLRVRLPGWQTRQLHGRPRKISFDVKQMIFGAITGQLEYVALDPRFYDDNISTLTGSMPIFPGLGFPISFDVTFGGLGSHVFMPVNNVGNFPTRPVAVIQGPVENPLLENVNTGQKIRFLTTLTASDALIVDFDARTVLLDNVSRYGTLAPGSVWWELDPGVTNVRFLGSNYNASATAALYWRSAWL